MRCRAIWVLLMLCASATGAWSQDNTAAARAAFGAGVKAFAAGKNAEALDSFREAYRLKPNPVVLYNIARSEDAIGLPASAMAHLEQYLREAKNIPKERKEEVKKDVARLRNLAGVVTVDGGEPGATISLDGVSQGVAPLDRKMMVDPGKHRLMVEADGFEPFDAQITVNAGEQRRIEVKLEKKGRAGMAAGAFQGGSVSQGQGQGQVGRASDESTESARRSLSEGDVGASQPTPGDTQNAGVFPPSSPVDAPSNGISRGWFWGSLTATGILAAAAITTGVVTLSKSSEYKDPATPIDRRRELMESGPTWARTTDILIAASAVAAGTTLILYFKTDWGVRPTPGGMELAGKF